MSPKATAKPKPKPKAAPVANTPPVPGPEPCAENVKYFANVANDMSAITHKWPNILDLAPLPETGTSGFRGLVGLGSPFNADVYTESQLVTTVTSMPYVLT